MPPEQTSSTLIASYSWTQDTAQMGALINGDSSRKPELINLVLRDLATVHGVTVEWLKQYYTPGDYFGWDWLYDPLTMGSAFLASGQPDSSMVFSGTCALFGPGEYGSDDIYGKLLLPAATGKLFFAGEGASACHTYVDLP